MKKKILNNDSGVTLVEILIGIVITSIMMAAIYTSYAVVNSSYSQVTSKAKISSSGRDIVGMLMRDIRMAGFKYYFGVNDLGISTYDNLQYVPGVDATSIKDSHAPLIIVKKVGYDVDDFEAEGRKLATNTVCCDRIHIVYGDFNQNSPDQKYKRYKITYYADSEEGNDYYSVYKTKQSWIQRDGEPTGDWSDSCSECFNGEKIRDHIEDMEFVVTGEEGEILEPAPRPDDSTRDNLFSIKVVDVRLTFRSGKKFYREEIDRGTGIPRLVKGIRDRTTEFFDRFLRDSVLVSVHTRNIGSGL